MLECMHDHVRRDAWLQATCWSRRSEDFCQHTSNNVGVSANRMLLAAAPPIRRLERICGQPIYREAGGGAVSAQLRCSPHNQATRELRARRVSGGAARNSEGLRQQLAVSFGEARRTLAAVRQTMQPGRMAICDSGTQLFCLGRWPDTGRSQSPGTTSSRGSCLGCGRFPPARNSCVEDVCRSPYTLRTYTLDATVQAGGIRKFLISPGRS